MSGRRLVMDSVDGGPGRRRIILQGNLDSSTVGEFDDRISQEGPAWNGDDVVVDLCGLEYISSAGVRSLLHLERILGEGFLRIGPQAYWSRGLAGTTDPTGTFQTRRPSWRSPI